MASATNEREDEFRETKEDIAPVHGRLPAHLTEHERGVLKTLEDTVFKAVALGFEAGTALGIIRSQRLWRDTIIQGERMRTFYRYCKVKFGIQPSTARTMIAAAMGAKVLEEETGVVPKHPTHVRPMLTLLKRAKPEVRAKAVEAWREAVQRPKSNEKTIREEVHQAVRQAVAEAPAAASEAPLVPPAPAHAETVLDVMRWVGDLEGKLFGFIDVLETLKNEPNDGRRQEVKTKGAGLIKEMREAFRLL